MDLIAFFGHMFIGTFLLTLGIWWSYVTCIRFIQSRTKRIGRKTYLSYKSTTTMPCFCLPYARRPYERYSSQFD